MMQPILIPIIGKESGDRWMLTGAWDGKANLTGRWAYEFGIASDRYRLEIPHRFDALDGASVPRFLQAIIRMGGREMPDEAWLPHDFFYHHKGRMPNGTFYKLINGDWVPVEKVSKQFADRVFYNELKQGRHGLSSFKAPVAYAGVRAAFWKGF
jgi:hypothetical protein